VREVKAAYKPANADLQLQDAPGDSGAVSRRIWPFVILVAPLIPH